MAQISFSLSASKSQIDRIDAMLAGIAGGAKKALNAAGNECMRKFRTQLTNDLDEVFNAGRNTILHTIKLSEGFHGDHHEGRVTVSRKKIPLWDFKPQVGKRLGVRAAFMTGDPVKTFKHSFKARMPGGHLGVFNRLVKLTPSHPTKGRYAGHIVKRGKNKGKPILRRPIGEDFGPPAVLVFERHPDVAQRAIDSLAEIFDRAIESKIDWLLKTSGK